MKLISAEAQAGNKTYTIRELFEDLRKEVWKELAGKKTVDVYRRNLQKMHIAQLMEMIERRPVGNTSINQTQRGFAITNTISSANSDILSMAKAELKEVRRMISTALPATNDKMTKYHLQDCLERINLALNPK
jgi:DNA-binding protein Fis